ncbi:DHA2 family efflux MFS transporter permease subunit [Sphingomonas sp. QA11]|uniref:DHA2 family efflux MFS transporter permease subunit n=1 Tax=Sphingomonas sp. QA11 TaxID=2950605 RepID=UPI00234B8C75|nr:DHA2 family efflux MFS transporter permease subunit [Sphingomonas sp. QA11]WCM25886.1 DHA2 family efflux MFS transporter permease subunit [Sphingomonas sp. QA11]
MNAVSPAATPALNMPDLDSPGVRVWLGYGLMCLGLFMAILDLQIVATSLPTIQRGLNINPDQMSWVQTAYLTAEVVTIPLSGLMMRALSLRWLTALAIGGFTIASAACALSTGFEMLVVTRIVQGAFAGMIIPLVFTAVFMLFPSRLEALATSIAGALAVLAPSLGPVAGGWITQSFNWHWLFLVNIAPGVAATVGTAWLLPRGDSDFRLLRHCDGVGLGLLAAALGLLQVGLKQAPSDGWLSLTVIGLLVGALVAMLAFVRHSLARPAPLVRLAVLRDGRVATGSALNFALGAGMFGAAYLMPLFLALVRDLDALAIGEIMLVTGVAQLVATPLAVILEKRVEPHLLSIFGFALFGVGFLMSGFQAPDSDAAAMFWPQIVRGAAIMLCILPPTRLALGHLAVTDVPNASGLFNLMRNLGGAVGIALIDTIVFNRTPTLASGIIARLHAGDVPTARLLGLPIDEFLARHNEPIDADTRALIEPLIRHHALTGAINEAWLAIGTIMLIAVAATLAILVHRHRDRAPVNQSAALHPSHEISSRDSNPLTQMEINDVQAV